MTNQTTELEYLMAIDQIAKLKARYCRLVDAKQWDELRKLFVDDFQFENPGAKFSVGSADAFVEAVREALGDAVTMHHCHNPEIELVGAEEAIATWAMEDRINYRDPQQQSIHGFGHYKERYKSVDGNWLIADMKLIYMFQDPEWKP